VVRRVAAAAHVVGLLSRHVAADVLAVHGDARRLLEDDPRVARRRNALQQFVGERLLRSGLTRADDGAFARHRDRLLHRRYFQLGIHRGAEADGDDDVLLDDGLETGQFELDRIGADVQTWELIRARLAGTRRLR